jgi:ribosomal protein S18 acetylase RimI-like enzyme
VAEIEIRAMAADDVGSAEEVWHRAASAMRAESGTPARPLDTEARARTRRAIGHLVSSDPGGSWVARVSGQVVGLAQAIRREGLWVLSLLGVDPEHQSRGLGRALLEAAAGYGTEADTGLIMSSRDPRAVRRYGLAGFEVRPTVSASGRVRPGTLSSSPELRNAGLDGKSLVAAIDRAVRGASHGVDLDYLLGEGHRLVLLADEAYALCRGARPVLLGARSDAAAEALLCGLLARAEADEIVELGWVTGDQQWAIRAALRAGLELHPSGPLMVRGEPGPLRPYLPSGMFG